MARPLRVLVVEDSPEDAAIVLRELKRAGYDVLSERVETEADLLAALERQPWDLVLSDFAMPEFNGLRAFDLIKEREIEIPFIFVSGRIGEDRAAEAMKRGASDYILKDKLARLAPAVERELQDAEARRQRRQMAAMLKESEEKYKSLVEGSLQGIAIHQQRKLIFANRAMVGMFGYGSVEELLALPDFTSLLAPEERDRVETYAATRLGGGEAPGVYQCRGLKKDGTSIWIEIFPWRVNWQGNPAIQFAAIDITQRRQAEEELHAQRRLLKTVFDSLPLWVSVRDRNGRYLLINRSLMDSLEKPESELRGMTRSQIGLGTPEEVERIEQLDRQVIVTGEARDDPEVPITMPDGVVHRFHVIRTPLRDEAGLVQGLVSVSQDITDRLSLEEQFRQAQKLESIGRLAGGVAHDFNNMLTVILSYAESLLEKFPPDASVRADLAEIHEAGMRAAGLTRQLLAFSRRQFLEIRPIQLNEVVSGLEKFLGRLIGEDIRLSLGLHPEAPVVMADEGQIEQVLMNLVVNARDAMPQGGRLLIETAPVALDQEYAERHVSVKPGQYVQLTVTDTGTGMDEATQRQIFEPFFTTKEKGKGTGLGLATVYGIVKQLGGNIWVYSEPGKGTTFKIYLPCAESTDAAATKAQGRAVALGGSEAILLVEDDAAVRRAARRILEGGGYRVAEAANGQEALTLLTQGSEPIDLLLSDVVMPEMGGKDLAERFGALRPGTPVLYMSGYTENAIAHQGVLDSGTYLLQKPFTRDSLLRKVRETLDQTRTPSGSA